MKPDYITINDQRFRVEINMNTVEDWELLSGKKLGQFETEAALSAKTGGVATRAMLLWFFCAIREGEDLDGRVFELDFDEFKKILRPSIMMYFTPIFLKQYIGNNVGANNDSPKPDDEQKKKKTIRSHFQDFVRSRWAKWVLGLLIFVCAVLWYYGMHLKA